MQDIRLFKVLDLACPQKNRTSYTIPFIKNFILHHASKQHDQIRQQNRKGQSKTKQKTREKVTLIVHALFISLLTGKQDYFKICVAYVSHKMGSVCVKINCVRCNCRGLQRLHYCIHPLVLWSTNTNFRHCYRHRVSLSDPVLLPFFPPTIACSFACLGESLYRGASPECHCR